jgi:AraC family transcriptional regulator
MSTSVGSKYEVEGSELIKSSTKLGWNSQATAEIYKHKRLDSYDFVQPITEVVINISGTANYCRRADGPEQKFISRSGSASICPRGVNVKYLHIDSGPLNLLHIYMPVDLFGMLRCPDGDVANAGLIYTGGFHDPLVQSIGFAVAEELMKEVTEARTSQLFLDSFAVGLAARLLQQYTQNKCRNFTETYFDALTTGGLDRTRLNRVIDFIQNNIDSDISLDDLAKIACLSAFHFCRAFKTATGLSPFQYISEVRINKAKVLLAHQRTPINDIALSTGFSTGANLARAFKKAVGLSPSQYRMNLIM